MGREQLADELAKHTFENRDLDCSFPFLLNPILQREELPLNGKAESQKQTNKKPKAKKTSGNSRKLNPKYTLESSRNKNIKENRGQ